MTKRWVLVGIWIFAVGLACGGGGAPGAVDPEGVAGGGRGQTVDTGAEPASGGGGAREPSRDGAVDTGKTRPETPAPAPRAGAGGCTSDGECRQWRCGCRDRDNNHWSYTGQYCERGACADGTSACMRACGGMVWTGSVQ